VSREAKEVPRSSSRKIGGDVVQGAPALVMNAVTKAFGDILALDDVSLAVRWGEVHALLGENGAGKSTIMNVATGVYAANRGTIEIDGQRVAIANPMDATRHGLGMVHQHFRLVPNFTVAENILLACCHRTREIRSLRAASSAVVEMGARVGLSVDPDVRVNRLSIAEQQRAEILKVLLLGARIIVLDEPTAVLTDQESAALLDFVRSLAKQGSAVVLITHKLREVMGFSDRVTVMRRGRVVLDGAMTAGLDAGTLAQSMVGESVVSVNPPLSKAGVKVLGVENLVVRNSSGGVGVDGLSLEVSQGEILGLAGVGGNGQQQLADCLMGLVAAEGGRIELCGRDVTRVEPFTRRKAGLRSVPSDRFAAGLIADMSVAENLALTDARAGRYGGYLHLARAAMETDAASAIEAFSIAGATPRRAARLLSGGNAQKLVLARELGGNATVLIAHSPTRGLDVRACHFVHSTIKRAVEAGMACLLISEDMDEVLALSTRIAVISRGTIVATFASGEATSTLIGKAMLGHA